MRSVTSQGIRRFWGRTPAKTSVLAGVRGFSSNKQNCCFQLANAIEELGGQRFRILLKQITLVLVRYVTALKWSLDATP